MTRTLRGEARDVSSRSARVREVIRLSWVSDAYMAQVAYRARCWLRDLGVPLLPRLAHRFSMSFAQVSIGDAVTIGPGLYLLHGSVVIDGIVDIGPGVVIAPFVTVGLRAGELQGPTIEPDVVLGTGAKILGPVVVGKGSRIGANAGVVSDVPPGTTVVGAPAHPTAGSS